ncbi:MAG: hypothetical protein QOH59_3027 [Gemmatimonadales bacterium]|jgi:hypothetical protein|nr:hypothetical protein [Gemmatimonadales bacterium]
MRTALLLPITALVAAVAGCGAGAKEQQTASLPQRDLTLVTQTAQVEVASAVEIQRLRPQHLTARLPQSRQPTVRHAVFVASAPIPPAEPAAQPVTPEPISTNDRELLPGKTVTLIPVSTGPSAAPDEPGELPSVRGRTMVGHGGGTCRGGRRGPGIGSAPAPRPDFR